MGINSDSSQHLTELNGSAVLKESKELTIITHADGGVPLFMGLRVQFHALYGKG